MAKKKGAQKKSTKAKKNNSQNNQLVYYILFFVLGAIFAAGILAVNDGISGKATYPVEEPEDADFFISFTNKIKIFMGWTTPAETYEEENLKEPLPEQNQKTFIMDLPFPEITVLPEDPKMISFEETEVHIPKEIEGVKVTVAFTTEKYTSLIGQGPITLNMQELTNAYIVQNEEVTILEGSLMQAIESPTESFCADQVVKLPVDEETIVILQAKNFDEEALLNIDTTECDEEDPTISCKHEPRFICTTFSKKGCWGVCVDIFANKGTCKYFIGDGISPGNMLEPFWCICSTRN